MQGSNLSTKHGGTSSPPVLITFMHDGLFYHCDLLQELFFINQQLLNAIGVGHPAIDKVCGLAASLGLGAKLTGGGGGGCVMALLPTGESI